MSAARGIGRRLIAGMGAVGVAAGLAMAASGTAQAAVPNKWGFAYVSQPAVAGTPDLAHQAGSWPAPMHAHTTPGPADRVFVRFPTLASKNGVVHVTAVNSGAVFCQALGWTASGADEIVGVRCHKAGGAPVFSPFTVMYTSSSKGPFPAGAAYGYVHWQPGLGIVGRFNSSGNPNVVTPVATGVWRVSLLGLFSSGQAGNAQVTAANPKVTAKCEIQKWTGTGNGQYFQVNCYNAAAVPLNTGWSLSYQRARAITGLKPKAYAYTFNNKPLIAGPYAPTPAAVNFNSLGGLNTIRRAGGGLSLVSFPRVGVLPNTVLVTPFAVGPGFCNLVTLWATAPGAAGVTVRDVACYTSGGTLKSQKSLITYTAR